MKKPGCFSIKSHREVEEPKKTVAELVKMLEEARRIEPAIAVPVPIRRALLIGINYFGSSCELSGCINDTSNIYVWLTKECGYNPADIRVLTDDPHQSPELVPTRANIVRSIEWLQAVAHDTPAGFPVKLFFHYSGHGSWTADLTGDESDRRDESICPVDYPESGCILDDELRDLIIKPIAEKDNVQLSCLFDCCHSGTSLDLRYDYEVAIGGAKADRRTYTMTQSKAQPNTKCNVTLWSGCLDTQTSADAYIARQAQGAMTWGFLKTVRKYRLDLSYKRLLSELQTQLLTARYEQVPHLSCSKLVGLSDRVVF